MEGTRGGCNVCADKQHVLSPVPFPQAELFATACKEAKLEKCNLSAGSLD